MSTFAEHPTVRNFEVKRAEVVARPFRAPLDAAWLRELCLGAGADDAGFVEIERPEMASQRDEILNLLPRTQTLISIVCRMNRENIRAPFRSIANVEFHHTTDQVNEAARKIVAKLEELGIRAVYPTAGFPMEMERFSEGKVFVVSHKPIAVAAGLGQMGIHRNVIHPRFGSFILLGTVLMDATVTSYSRAIDYNPCLTCKLCIAACPTGAIGADGAFNFSACYTHNYREFMGGFNDWVATIAGSRSTREYQRNVSAAETASMWQSLSFGANYKAAYCLAVCPAGEDVIGPFLTGRKQFLDEVVKPLQSKSETVYVVRGSDAEDYVIRRFPKKTIKCVSNGLRVGSINAFLRGLALNFQRDHSKGVNATYHFTFIGDERRKATVIIREQTLRVYEGHIGTPDIRIAADTRSWLRFLAKEKNIVGLLLRREIRFRGSPRLLLAFGRCFPS
jgi:Fe-S-cluster-containing hydrogenase component 2